ncbi:hypothetical protein [Priestia filamentosa]|uniref:hypothetical protein n=2 Tax=Priestia filamentosa TaxID=1402861 RepID=UPI000588FA5D|nr:hypothetical protein [Priestia filamentosa]RJS62716.1 hypothetical protein CJ485_25335 [Priestia filamentosa]
MAQIILWLLLVGPWFLLPLFNKERIKRFMPVGLFAALVLTVVFQIAEKLDWWIIKENIFFLTNITPFVYGAFLVGTVIIFYLSYPSFIFYMVLNLLFDLFQAFVVHPIFEWTEIYKVNHINSIGLFFLMISIAILIYLYQKWQDEAFKDEVR